MRWCDFHEKEKGFNLVSKNDTDLDMHGPQSDAQFFDTVSHALMVQTEKEHKHQQEKQKQKHEKVHYD